MEGQAMMGLLVFGLAGILLTHAYVSQRLATGQTAFTGLWLLSAVVLLIGYPESWPYLSWGGVGMMLAVHGAYLVGSLAVRPRASLPPAALVPKPALVRSVRLLYWISVVLSVVGVALLIAATGAWQLVNGVSASTVRYALLDPDTIPLPARILSNAILLPAALAPMMSIAAGRRRLDFKYYALPCLCLLGQSVAFGGRGGVTFGGLLIVWGYLTARSQGYFARLDRRTALTLGGVVLAILAYQQAIFAGRTEFGSNGGFGDYIALPLPAGCEVLAENLDQPTLAFGFGNLAPVREGLRAAGVAQEKRVDSLLVEVPQEYNVFTYLFEGIMAFGYVGVVLVAFGLGALGGWLESGTQSVTVLGIRSLLYCYLGMTLFADLAFFYTGWSLAMLALLLGLPVLTRLFSPPHGPYAERLGATRRG